MPAQLKSTRLKYVMVFVIMSGMVFFMNFNKAFADISPSSYCQIAIGEMEQQKSNYIDLINLANQYKDNPTTLAEQEEIKRAEFDQEKEARYSSYGITAQEFVLYMGKNAASVNAYLEANPDVKQQMDDLKAQLNALADEHASLKEAINQQAVPPSP